MSLQPQSRRQFLHASSTTWISASVAPLLQWAASSTASAANPAAIANPAPVDRSLAASFGRAKSVLWVYLSGGPSQYETFDPKPDAPAEIRGSFSPIATSVTGVQFCELLPRISTIAHKLAVVRSFATDDPNHESAGYWINTGRKYAGPDMRALAPTDWPTLGSIIKMLKPTEGGPFSSVMLPEAIIANPNVFLPGQNAGFLGRRWDPEILKCDPSSPEFRIESLTLPEQVSPARLQSRGALLTGLNSSRQADAQRSWTMSV